MNHHETAVGWKSDSSFVFRTVINCGLSNKWDIPRPDAGYFAPLTRYFDVKARFVPFLRRALQVRRFFGAYNLIRHSKIKVKSAKFAAGAGERGKRFAISIRKCREWETASQFQAPVMRGYLRGYPLDALLVTFLAREKSRAAGRTHYKSDSSPLPLRGTEKACCKICNTLLMKHYFLIFLLLGATTLVKISRIARHSSSTFSICSLGMIHASLSVTNR